MQIKGEGRDLSRNVVWASETPQEVPQARQFCALFGVSLDWLELLFIKISITMQYLHFQGFQ